MLLAAQETTEKVGVEEFYVGRFKSNTSPFGEEQRICDCGGELEAVAVYYEDGIIYKICPNCGEERYINVWF